MTHNSAETVISRRTRFGVMSAITLASLLAAVLFANIIAERRTVRFDLTATREHTLAPRTQAILAQIDQPIEIVVSADARSIDARSMQRVRDVLGEFEQASAQIGITIVDTGSSAALDDFARVIALLADRGSANVSVHLAALTRAESGLQDLATSLPRLAESLLSVASASASADTANINSQALLIGEVASSCSKAAEDVHVTLTNTIAGTILPASDQAQDAANAPFQNAIATADAVAQWADAIAQRARDASDDQQRAIASLARELAITAQRVRDLGSAAFDDLSRLGPLEPLQIARALQVTPAVLIIGPGGTTAINLESLFPVFANPNDTASRVQVRFVGEELITTAISTLLLDDPPIVVIVHGETERLLDASGRLVNPNGAGLASLIDRCRLRRMDVVEWPAALDFARPSFTAINPDGKRPLVWFVPGAPTRLNLDRTNGLAQRAMRVGHLADALQTLVNARQSIFLAIEPSELPSAGQPDILIKPLESAFGISIDTGRPLIERIAMPDAVGFAAYQTPRTVGHSAIAHTLGNLKTILQWPMSITETDTQSVIVTPVLQVDARTSVWGETQWLSYRYANDRQPYMAFAPRSPITADPDRDNVAGPWTVAATVERRGAATTGERVQRMVIVASPSWYEPFYEQSAQLDGRHVALHPGNRELFDASLWWLSDLDDMVAPAATSLDMARIAQLTPTQLSMWRWVLIAGLPVFTLLCGIVHRTWRG